jgi:hypothetical protein
VDARSILGVSAVRTAFLDHVSAPNSAQGQAGHGADFMISRFTISRFTLEDDPDEDLDDEDDVDEDEDEDDEEDDDEEEIETWQVFAFA